MGPKPGFSMIFTLIDALTKTSYFEDVVADCFQVRCGGPPDGG